MMKFLRAALILILFVAFVHGDESFKVPEAVDDTAPPFALSDEEMSSSAEDRNLHHYHYGRGWGYPRYYGYPYGMGYGMSYYGGYPYRYYGGGCIYGGCSRWLGKVQDKDVQEGVEMREHDDMPMDTEDHRGLAEEHELVMPEPDMAAAEGVEDVDGSEDQRKLWWYYPKYYSWWPSMYYYSYPYYGYRYLEEDVPSDSTTPELVPNEDMEMKSNEEEPHERRLHHMYGYGYRYSRPYLYGYRPSYYYRPYSYGGCYTTLCRRLRAKEASHAESSAEGAELMEEKPVVFDQLKDRKMHHHGGYGRYWGGYGRGYGWGGYGRYGYGRYGYGWGGYGRGYGWGGYGRYGYGRAYGYGGACGYRSACGYRYLGENEPVDALPHVENVQDVKSTDLKSK